MSSNNYSNVWSEFKDQIHTAIEGVKDETKQQAEDTNRRLSNFIKVGTYTGDASDPQKHEEVDFREINDIGFEPEAVILCRVDGSFTLTRSSISEKNIYGGIITQDCPISMKFDYIAEADKLVNVAELTSNGFKVRNAKSGDVASCLNSANEQFVYIAFKKNLE